MKFINLLKKELSELINAQMLISLAAILLIFMFLGNIMKDAINEEVTAATTSYAKINISDRDDTDFTHEMLDYFTESGTTVNKFDSSGTDYADILSSNDISTLLIIPEGFTEAVESGKQPEIISIARMRSAATMANISNNNSAAQTLITSYVSKEIANSAGMTDEDIVLMSDPVVITENTIVDDKSSQTSIEAVTSKITIQNMILPIIVFVLIILTSQMLVSAISNEKIDKTLETLLSAPVSRGAVIGSKMLAAAIVALVNAVVYMLGFSSFVSGATDSLTDSASNFTSSLNVPAGQIVSSDAALAELGLSLGAFDYFLVGLQLFFTIMICLSVSIMLGALVNDTKNSQTVIMPIMILAMVPYMVSMFKDVNSLPMAFRIVVYAIPFTHTFSAIPNLMFGNRLIFFCGLIYQVIVFALCMFFALRLFKSDKLFTISLNFGQKSKYKKNSAGSSEE